MTTMYRTGCTTHETDSERPGRALCGRSVEGWLDLDALDGWSRVGFSAASSGPCQRCSTRQHELSVSPDRSVADAYRAGWKASAKIDGPRLEDAEDRYALTHNMLEQDAFTAGWLDYASDLSYGWSLTTPVDSIPTAKDPIVIDNTPAGIFAAMMRANASEQTAPQSRLYGLLSDHLRRTLTAVHGAAGDAVYGAVIRSGEASDDVISGALADFNYLQNDGLIYTQPQTGARTYIGPAIHDGSPAEHIRAALTAAQDHPVPAVRRILQDVLSARLAAATPGTVPSDFARPVLTAAAPATYRKSGGHGPHIR